MKLKINKKWKYIAKNADGYWILHTSKAKYNNCCWDSIGELYVINDIFTNFPECKSEDSLHEILPDGTLRKVVPDLPKDTPVLVRNTTNSDWARRHFSHFNERGEICCFYGGTTSFTGHNDCTPSWYYWKLPEDE